MKGEGCGGAAELLDTPNRSAEGFPNVDRYPDHPALGLIGVVLLQRSEGGGLGIGGGGGGGMTTGRSAATALSRVTWILGTAFMIAALTLTIIAAGESSGTSVLDRIGDAPAPSTGDLNDAPTIDGESLLPPGPVETDDAPLIPTDN